MQGWPTFIPTTQKIDYINNLLSVGFDTLDFGSFVSPKAIPQMADTKEVVAGIARGSNSTKLLAIVANVRGAEEAAAFSAIDCLGFPFSVSETFQRRNTNSTIAESLERVKAIRTICTENQQTLVVYLSMGFGNPYKDPFSRDIALDWMKRLTDVGVEHFSLADTVGVASPEQVYDVTHFVINSLPGYEVGVHLHSSPVNASAKIDAALRAGCTRFDSALKGIGGCPMANDELVGNLDTEYLVARLDGHDLTVTLNRDALARCSKLAEKIFK